MKYFVRIYLSMAIPSPLKSYMPQLDALRAIAILAVVFGHCEWEDFSLVVVKPYCLMLSVRLFFILSGFLITRILLAELKLIELGTSRVSLLVKFYLRRALRILPAYYFVLLMGLIFQIPPFRDFIWWCITFSINFLFAYNCPSWAGPIVPFWTLAIEWQFYILWALAVLFLNKDRFLNLSVVLLIVSPVSRLASSYWGTDSASGYLLPSVIDWFVAGGLLGSMGSERQVCRATLTFLFYFYGSMVITFILSSMFFKGDLVFISKGIEQTAFLPLLSWVVYRTSIGFSGILGSILNSTLLTGIGKISYAIYLVHFPVLYSISTSFQKYHMVAPAWLLFVVTLSVSIPVSIAIRVLIENPMQRYRSKIA